MTHDEMIAVIQAHKEGKYIETRRRDGGGGWVDLLADVFDFVNFEHRIKPTPVPPGDLTWEEAKDLHNQGVRIQWCDSIHKWCDVTYGGCFECKDDSYGWKTRTAYRRAPVPRKVPLGPEDVPPGSVVKHPKWTNDIWSYCQPKNRCLFVVGYGEFSYETMQSDGWLIKRPGQDWQRCEKDEVVK